MTLRTIYISQISWLVALLLFSCSSGNEEEAYRYETTSVPVQFSSMVSQPTETRAGTTGEMTDASVKATGFGVFAYHTDTQAWTAAKATATPNFMYNQLVTWNGELSDDYVTKWEYAPIKYWPNDFSTGDVDDQDDDQGNNAATGSQNGGRVSFFAYAPYAEVTPGTGAVTETDAEDVVMNTWGIRALTTNAAADDPRVSYGLNPASVFLKDNVDLLWGVAPSGSYQSIGGVSAPTEGFPPKDLTKPSVIEAVKLRFLHALAQLRILVQGAFDEVIPAENDVAEDTRILINSLTVTMASPTGAWLNLNNTAANMALWQTPLDATPQTFSFTLSKDDENVEGKLRADIRNQADIRTYLSTADNFDQLLEGVTVTPKNILNLPESGDETDYGLLFIPAKNETEADGKTLKSLNQVTVDVDYDVITRDPSLVRNTSAGFSIVNNHIHRTLQLAGDVHFEASKKYTLRIILGMTTVKFEIIEVEDWMTPITMNPLVREWITITKEYDINE
ncbi:MAG: fimbrillin family protein [Bacteroidaceae bacterium]|nr:fimbrillin family protein [Bacteroidaceae bacterium]